MPGYLPRCFEKQNLLTLLPDYFIPLYNADVRWISRSGPIHKETNCVYMLRRWLETFSTGWNPNEIVQETKYFASVKGSRLCKEISHHYGSGMWNVQSNRTLSRR